MDEEFNVSDGYESSNVAFIAPTSRRSDKQRFRGRERGRRRYHRCNVTMVRGFTACKNHRCYLSECRSIESVAEEAIALLVTLSGDALFAS